MQIPLHFYLFEFKLRLFYFFFSFITCLMIIVRYHEAIFFFVTYTFSFINAGKFIATHIAELFATSIYISINITLVINFPFAYYHCSRFFSSSWYKSQIWFFTNLQISTSLIFYIAILVCYFFILPSTYVFLNTWTVATIYAFKVQLEARIETYICWTLQTVCLLSNITYIFFVRVTSFYLIDNMINLHIFFRKNKKYALFFICLITSMCLPPESFIQVSVIFCITVLSEIFFFVTCLFFAKNNV